MWPFRVKENSGIHFVSCCSEDTWCLYWGIYEMYQFIYGAQHDICGILGSQYKLKWSSHRSALWTKLGCIYNEGTAEEVNPQCLRSFLKFSSPFSRSSCCFFVSTQTQGRLWILWYYAIVWMYWCVWRVYLMHFMMVFQITVQYIPNIYF